MDTFLNDIEIPTINKQIHANLEQPITLKEIYDSIMYMNNGKTPGPDGFTSEFYKKNLKVTGSITSRYI